MKGDYICSKTLTVWCQKLYLEPWPDIILVFITKEIRCEREENCQRQYSKSKYIKGSKT